MTQSSKRYRLGRCPASELETAAPEAWLSPAEAAAHRALRTPKRRRDWLAGRIAAKRLVLGWLEERGLKAEPAGVEIANDRTGAPSARLPGGLGVLPISISHSASGGVAALAEAGGPVGVDLEQAEVRPSGFLSVMVHESEWTPDLNSTALEQTRLWTAKEAVSKLLGVGLSVDLWDIRFVPDGTARRLELHGRARERWAALGSPEIRLDTFITQDDVLSIAYSAS